MVPSERLYYSDSFLSTFTASIKDVSEFATGDNQPAWRLSLDRTAFYPTSGGQPFDTGLLRSSLPNGTSLEIPVEQVEEEDAGTVWHYVRTPIAPGTRIEGQINWDRRFDHMQQHTGQHLLSAIFFRELHAPTISFHLGEAVSTIDIASEPLAHHSLERIERIANQILCEDRPITIHHVSRADAESMLASGKLRKLPEREGMIRLIEITDCDLNACGGTHVRSTGQIGGLLVRRVEKMSRGLRIEFVCGLRAIRTARTDAAILNETSALLSTGPAELYTTVTRLLAGNNTGAKERQKLREELAAYHAKNLVSEVPMQNGLRLIVHAWKDRDRDYIKLLASRTAASAPSTAAIFSAHEDNPARVFLARSRDLNLDCGRILRDALANLGLRGGGSADLAQGDVPLDKEPVLLAAITEKIYQLCNSAQ